MGGHGSSIDDGAIAAYQAGDKARAWWLMGHAAHLLGDLSTGAHTLNRNWHGVVGDAYHDWMATRSASAAGRPRTPPWRGACWTPTAQGSTPSRRACAFWAYTTARLGAAFPWHRTRGYVPHKGPVEGAASRQLAGDGPHYDAYLTPILAGLPTHPRALRDIASDEVTDSGGACREVSRAGRGETRADCWDGGDGHICRNNGPSGGNDMDGDLSRIGDVTYVQALRSIAGLLYLFARETGSCLK